MTGDSRDGANDMNVCSSFCVSLRKPLFALLFVRLAVIPPTMHNHAAVTRVQTGTHMT